MKTPISRFTIHGNSMFPTLHSGQDVLSFNWFVKPKIGDIVVIKKNGKEMVKRIIKISRSKIFVKGDNRDKSTDSRHFGAVDMDQIVGKMVYKSDYVDCPQCRSFVKGIYGRKDAICGNCGFKLTCCGDIA